MSRPTARQFREFYAKLEKIEAQSANVSYSNLQRLAQQRDAYLASLR